MFVQLFVGHYTRETEMRGKVPELVRIGLDISGHALHNESDRRTRVSSSLETRISPAWPQIFRYCATCQRETRHQQREGAGVVVTICVPCLERALSYELDGD
jgi:hypothetical protein